MKVALKVLACITSSCHFVQATIPLFEQYPGLQQKLPHVSLGNYPTPIIEAKLLAKTLGIKEFYIKDDGIVGGNKNRKLEFLLGDAVAKGFKTVCTDGSTGSNHACETARCAQLLGLKSVLLLNDQLPTSYTVRNLKLDLAFGAKCLYSKAEENDEINAETQELSIKNNYYYIPMGGSNELATLGFVNAMFELRKQINDKVMKEPDVIYVALGTTGTAAGIIIGAKLANFKCKIIPVRISYTSEVKTKVLVDLIKQTEKFMHELDPKFGYVALSSDTKTTDQLMTYLQKEYNTFIVHDMTGEGYAAATKSAADAIDLLDSELHFKIEGTYSGKAASALVRDALRGQHKDNVVLFWNTFNHGKFENLTSQVNQEQIASLPIEYQHYFTDQLQELDRGL